MKQASHEPLMGIERVGGTFGKKSSRHLFRHQVGAVHTARPCLSHRGTETKRTALMDRSPWCDEEMYPQEGHSMPGGNEGASQTLIFSSAWCSAIVHGLACLCTLVSPGGRY